MRCLPSLTIRGHRVHLPLCDSTAEAILGALLSSEGTLRQEQLSQSLLFDPALTLWCLLQPSSDCSDIESTPSIEQLAQWLVANLSDGLLKKEWTKETDDLEDDSTFANLACQSVAAASLLAGEENPIESSEYFLGLLSNASDWLASEPETFLSARLVEAIEKLPPTDVSNKQANARGELARQYWTANSSLSKQLPELIERLSRLERLESDFQTQLEEEKLQAMYALAAGAGHEINNPLGSIAGRAQLLVRDESDPQRRRTLAKINTQAFRAHEMISDMMLFSRPPAPVRKEVEVPELIEEVLAELREAADGRGTIILQKPEDLSPETPLTISADRSQLAVALRAMCTNSLEAMGSGGQIEISAHATPRGRKPATVAIVVQDNGPGIESEQRRHLFDPFYSGREAGRGLGFGLSKCWRIVTNHGGKIDVKSEPGHGATFTLTLPVADPAGDPPEETFASLTPSSTSMG